MSKPLRIALIMQGGTAWMGGAEYIKNIILALANLPAEVRSTFEVCLLCDKSIDSNILSQVEPYLAEVFYLESPTIFSRVSQIVRRELFNEYYIHISKFLNTSPDHKIDFIYPYFTTKFKKGQPASAAWIPDFQHKYLPQLFTFTNIVARNKELENTAKYASTIVVSSNSAEKDLQTFLPDCKGKVRVLSFATMPSVDSLDPEQLQHILDQYNLPERFFLISNQFWQHKNHLTVFQAMKLLQQRNIYPVVVCTGNLYDSRSKGYIKKVMKTIDDLGISKQVHLTGLIPKKDQMQLMIHSLAIVQPSLFEGWSTIVEESKCLDKRIILSDIPVHLEQDPPKGRFFNKDSPEDLSMALADYWILIENNFDSKKRYNLKQENQVRAREFASSFLKIVKDSVNN